MHGINEIVDLDSVRKGSPARSVVCKPLDHTGYERVLFEIANQKCGLFLSPRQLIRPLSKKDEGQFSRSPCTRIDSSDINADLDSLDLTESCENPSKFPKNL